MDELRVRVGNLEADYGRLEDRSVNLQTSLDRIEKKVDGIDVSIRGNGHPGLNQRVRDLETAQMRTDREREERRVEVDRRLSQRGAILDRKVAIWAILVGLGAALVGPVITRILESIF